MSKNAHKLSGGKHARSAPLAESDPQSNETSISLKDYQAQLHILQVELVKLQRHFIGCGDKILVLVEGRDAAGKDGCIKRIVEYLSPRETRVVALGKPCDRERRAWYFQRYVEHLPVAEEFVLFNRSWYNRAGVEHVMGFCTKQEHEEFMNSVPKFEEMLIDSGISILKYYLDIDKDEQVKRLAERQRDPLKHWKSSPIDAVAVKHWKAYSATRDAMLLRTHARFEIADVEGLRPHYALTLRHWVARLERHHAEALQYVSESTWRVWRLYMAACALEFESGEIGVCQILASKRSLGSASIPLTRQHLYPASHRSRTAVICY